MERLLLRILEQYFTSYYIFHATFLLDLDLNFFRHTITWTLALYCSRIHKVMFPQFVRIASLSWPEILTVEGFRLQNLHTTTSRYVCTVTQQY